MRRLSLTEVEADANVGVNVVLVTPLDATESEGEAARVTQLDPKGERGVREDIVFVRNLPNEVEILEQLDLTSNVDDRGAALVLSRALPELAKTAVEAEGAEEAGIRYLHALGSGDKEGAPGEVRLPLT